MSLSGNNLKTQSTWVMLVIAVAMVFAFQGSRSLWGEDEGRYTAASIELMRTGNLVHIQLSDTIPHFTKPPMTYAMIAAGISAFGRNEWAARAPNAIALLGTLALMYLIARTLKPGAPWLPPLILLTSPLAYTGFHVITADGILTLFSSGGILLLIHAMLHADAGGASSRPIAYAGWFMLGLGVLTKGPVALLPVIPLLVWARLKANRKYRDALHLASGLPLLFIVSLSWFVVAAVRDKEILDYWMKRELAGRVLGTVKNHNSAWYGAIEVYGPALLAGFFPWSIVLLRRAWPRRREWMSRMWWREKNAHNPFAVLLLLWVAVPVLAFCLFPSRSHLYVMPLFVPLSLLVARMIPDDFLARSKKWRRLLLIWMLVMVSLRAYAAYLLPYRKDVKPMAMAVDRFARAEWPGAERVHLTFVGTGRIPFGIKFYHDFDIEALSLDDDPKFIGSHVPLNAIEQRFPRLAANEIFIVKQSRLDELIACARLSGLKPARTEPFQSWSFVRLVPE